MVAQCQQLFMPIINAYKIESQPLEIWLLTAHTKKSPKPHLQGLASEVFHLGEEIEGERIVFLLFHSTKTPLVPMLRLQIILATFQFWNKPSDRHGGQL